MITALAGAVWWSAPRIRVAFQGGDVDAEHEGQNDEFSEKATADGEQPESSLRVSRDSQGNSVLRVPDKTRSQIDLILQTLTAIQQPPMVSAFGRTQEDPSQSFVLRSPISGFLDAEPANTWPQLGDRIVAGATVGLIRPRLSAAERLDLIARVSQARAEVDEASAELSAARASYQSKKELNQNQRVVSERTLEESQAKVKTNEARLSAAMETVKVLEDALSSKPACTSSLPLQCLVEGIVTERAAQPGEAVEAGQVLLRTANFNHLLARVEIPVGDTQGGPVDPVRVVTLGDSDVLSARLIGPAPDVSGMTQSRAYLLSLDAVGKSLRPGMSIHAYLSLSDSPLIGVVVPRSAILRYGGADWVYVRGEKDVLIRTGIKLVSPVDGGWFVSFGVMPGQQVVTRGAGILLSEELKSQIEAEAEGEE